MEIIGRTETTPSITKYIVNDQNNHLPFEFIKQLFFNDEEAKKNKPTHRIITITQRAHQQYRELKKIDFTKAENLNFINSSAFMNCSKLEEITFPNSLVSIGTNAFMSCIALKQIIYYIFEVYTTSSFS